MLKLTFLVDNNSCSHDSNLKCEHGLSIYIEFNQSRFLFDTGSTNIYRFNAQLSQIDLSKLDFVVISHGHNDHTGGLFDLLSNFPNLKIYISKDVINKRFFTSRKGEKRYINTSQNLFKEFSTNFIFIESIYSPIPNLFIEKVNSLNFNTPKANEFLFSELDGVSKSDNFSHEQFLILNLENGDVAIISACTHTGILNVLEEVSKSLTRERIKYFIGGLHLIDEIEDSDSLDSIVNIIESSYPNLKIVTGHCTGMNSYAYLKSRLSKKIDLFCSGRVIEIE